MKILVIQLRRIGDILLTTPVLRYLKEAFPEATIDFLAEPCGRSVLETNPLINELLIYDRAQGIPEIRRIRKRGYTAVLDFMNNPRTAYLTWLSGARWRVGFKHKLRSVFYNIAVPIPREPEYVPKRKLRLVKNWLIKAGVPAPKNVSYRPEIHLSADDEKFADVWMVSAKTSLKKFVVLAPAHRHPIRQWRPEGFRDVALGLSGRGWRVFLAWGPGEEGLMEQIRHGHETEMALLPPTTIRQMAAVMKRAALTVTNDSGSMHTSVAVGTPTVTIYGPTRPIDWNPSLSGDLRSSRDIPLTATGLDCLGCHLDRCPIGHLCMKELSANEVKAACHQILQEAL